MATQEFPAAVIEKLGYYVYLLIDPRTKEVFYVGKGTGNRVFHHANAAIESSDATEKLDRIREIQANGLAVEYVMLRHGLTEETAFEVEAALIDYIDLESLTNEVRGYNSDDRGRMTVEDIIIKYDAPILEILEPVLLITINRRYRKGMTIDEIYEATRGNWVVGQRREKARYALAIYHGIVRAVFEIERWHPIQSTDKKTVNRWCFDGKVADALKHYVGGSTIRYPTKTQNPVRYINC